MNVPVEILSGLVAALLGIGGAWVTLKRLNRDLNGLGAKIGRLEKQHDILLMLLCPEDKKLWLAGILLRK